jgi:hypothetical protein
MFVVSNELGDSIPEPVASAKQIGRIINALTMNETCAIADFCSQ